jgi:hypothetical protein
MTEDKHKEIKCLGEEGAALIQIVDPHFQKIASKQGHKGGGEGTEGRGLGIRELQAPLIAPTAAGISSLPRGEVGPRLIAGRGLDAVAAVALGGQR